MVFIAGDRDIAGELAQEAMVRTLVAWDSFDDAEHARRFALRVAMNLARSRWRREWRTIATGLDTPSSRASGIDDSVNDRVVLLAEIARLSERQRACFALVDVLDLSPAEAARALGMLPSTVRVHLTRARRRLAAALASTYMEEVDR